MLKEEISELSSSKFDTVYFAGSITDRTPEDLDMLKEVNEERIETFNLKKKDTEDNSNGEYQGNPIFDNFEGYFKV